MYWCHQFFYMDPKPSFHTSTMHPWQACQSIMRPWTPSSIPHLWHDHQYPLRCYGRETDGLATWSQYGRTAGLLS